MEKEALENIADILHSLDTNHEFDALLCDKEKLRTLQAGASEQIQKTFTFLSQFGHLQGVLDKLKQIMQEAQEGKITYEDVREPLQKLAKISPEKLLEIYQISHTLFSEGHFAQAADVALFLTYVNPRISAFWRMVGSCYWNLGDEKSALGPFLYASIVNSLEIENHLAALDCLLQLGLTQEALNYYNTAKEVLGDAKQWDDIEKLDAKIAKI